MHKWSKKDKITGQFTRTIRKWSLENFNEGFIQGNRFFVYSPDHHHSNNLGYVLRSIIAYETYNNDIVTKDFCIHHKDKNKLNDLKENLQKLQFGEHTRLHCEKPKVECVCIICNKKFYLHQWRINQGRGKYCSSGCSQKREVTKETREKVSKSSLGRVSGMKGKKQSDKQKETIRNLFKDKSKELITCTVCGKVGGEPAMKRWHFKNCKEVIS